MKPRAHGIPPVSGTPSPGAGRAVERVPHRCLIRLRGLHHSLKSAERKAADVILAAPEEVSEIGIVDFARRAGCSEATISRLARKLGYDGFPEMKADLAKLDGDLPYRDIQASDSTEAVVRKVFANSIQALADTLATLDFEQCARAVDALGSAARLAFLGLGNAAAVAREAYQKFLRIGVPAFTAEDPDLQVLIVGSQLQRGDVLVAISYSGESRPIVDAARLARERGVVVIAITNFPRSTLARGADVVLTTAAFQEQVSGEIGSKRLAQLCLVETLYVNFLLRQGPRARRNLLASNEALGTNKTRNYVNPGQL